MRTGAQVFALADRAAINLGSGRNKRTDSVNVDADARTAPDVVQDLRVFPWPFADRSFDDIWCLDILEHLPDTVATMNEIHRIARPDALVHITTPHFTCANAFADPTHCHQFGMSTFDFFTGRSANRYTDKLFRYRSAILVFHPSRKNTLIRRLANRWPAAYERHFCWVFPAWFISVELVVVK